MKNDLPTGAFGRTLAGGRTAAKVGGKMLSYYVKRPFLSPAGRTRAKERAALDGAQTLFQGLSLLRGTALKMAQQLSLEMDLLPEAACQELAKAYHQVPPINRALVRKVVQDGLGRTPEQAFAQFDPEAFAAASLGQVHRAVDAEGRILAVKLQYPGIAKTIQGDLALVRHLLGPVIESEHLLPVLAEICARLHEEVDYLQEADNLCFFARNLVMEGIHIPQVQPDLTAATVLSTTLMPGRPLDLWIKSDPGQHARNHVAQKLSDMLVNCFYELRVVHADPNPGNFIIADDLTIGLVDFGCIKRVTSDFIENYRQLVLAGAHHAGDAHFKLMIELGLIPPDQDAETMRQVRKVSDAISGWFGSLFAEEYFDFKEHPGFIAQGYALMRRYHHLRRHLKVNPDFIFLDRTRYGLLRICEMLGARVRFRNPYEW
jgi:predicted unusual protein kinase regulating ubiquinone biosynthesis (AarF/ABC1/UbiB family)